MEYMVCDKPGSFSLRKGTEPVLTREHALLRVKRVGICGTDLHAFKGNQPFFSYPRILGHELAAEILEVGENPQGLRPGDNAIVIPYRNCEQCVACRAGKSNCCTDLKVLGVHTDGGMQEIISVPTRLLLPAEGLSLEEIAIAEPLSIGAHALRRAQVRSGDTIAVAGCGPIGIGIIQLARHIGATVIVIDINKHRLDVARDKFGADHTIDAKDSPLEKIREMTKGQLARCVFDATGNKNAIESSINYMQHGGTLALVGIFNGELAFHHPQIHARETTLMCSRNATPEDFRFVTGVLRQGRFNTGAYVTKKTGFRAIPSEFGAWAAPESKEIKVITIWD